MKTSYLVSYLLFKVLHTCDISALRLTNVGFLTLVGLATYYAGKTIAQTKHDKKSSAENWQLAHTAVNICLFPPLFFFSALYYTDIASLLCVVLSIHSCIWHLQKRSRGFSIAVLHVALGFLPLLFRQTNIFWVAIFPAALEAIDTLRSHPDGFSDKPIEAAKLEGLYFYYRLVENPC
jgi:alpha-1,2-glucosyltransferase